MIRQLNQLINNTQDCAPPFAALTKQIMLHFDMCPYFCQFNYTDDLRDFNGASTYANCRHVQEYCESLDFDWSDEHTDCRKFQKDACDVVDDDDRSPSGGSSHLPNSIVDWSLNEPM